MHLGALDTDGVICHWIACFEGKAFYVSHSLINKAGMLFIVKLIVWTVIKVQILKIRNYGSLKGSSVVTWHP